MITACIHNVACFTAGFVIASMIFLESKKFGVRIICFCDGSDAGLVSRAICFGNVKAEPGNK